MERKLATVLFVDLVDSTALVTGADPEVVRRRVQTFFDRVSHCVTTHGGIVEKFAGDAVLAAFGIPQAHEDDAERAARAALAIREEVRELGLESRIGLEAGELVVVDADSTFATGEAVNLAARLQQTAKPREFLEAAEGATVLTGRCLPYGEGITYWPLAEMVKAAAGISDDDPLEEAFDKLRACCEDDAVADLLGLASGLLEALQGERSPEEIAWAARELMEKLADVQPLALLFEDIHWAEERLLDLIEHLADWVRAPLLLLCLARPELLDVGPGWGGGRVRATAIELERLPTGESEELVDALLEPGGRALSASERATLLEKTEGNPL